MKTKKMNIMEIQAYLNEKGRISIPDLQYMYGLSYSEAGICIDLLIEKQFISAPAVGIYYPARHENLILRYVDVSEADQLYTQMKFSDIRLLQLLSNTDPQPFDAFLKEKDDDEDDESIAQAVARLLSLGLVAEASDGYRLRVNQTTLNAFTRIMRDKNRYGDSKEMSERSRKMFTQLLKFANPAEKNADEEDDGDV